MVLDFTKAIINLLPYGRDDYQFGVISFGNEATLEISLDQYSHSLDMLGAIDRIRWKDEWTNTSGGLKVMREEMFSFAHGARAQATKIGILITDGESNRDQQKTIPQALLVHQSGIKMFAIGNCLRFFVII